MAGSGTRNWRGGPGGTGIDAELGLADPASLAWALPAADSGAGPPLHRGWALGSTPARDLGRNVGGEKEEEEGRERERERRTVGFRQPRGTPPSGPRRVGWPGPATPGGGTGPTALSSGGAAQ